VRGAAALVMLLALPALADEPPELRAGNRVRITTIAVPATPQPRPAGAAPRGGLRFSLRF
jgi:hypothetical protein